MDEANNINISISGWPGSGSTTLAMILGLLLQRKCIFVGNIFRFLGLKFGYSEEGSSRPKFDDYIEDIIGKTIDNYIDNKLLTGNGYLIESDITSFLIGRHPKVFSVFLTTDFQERLKRVVSDNRTDAGLYLEKRDQILKQNYQDLWQIDYFDLELIKKKHSFVLDNSNMSLENEVRLVLTELQMQPQFNTLPPEWWESIYAKVPATINNYLEEGKEYTRKKLEESGLLMKTQEVLYDITKEFPEDIKQYPEKVKNIFLGIAPKN